MGDTERGQISSSSPVKVNFSNESIKAVDILDDYLGDSSSGRNGPKLCKWKTRIFDSHIANVVQNLSTSMESDVWEGPANLSRINNFCSASLPGHSFWTNKDVGCTIICTFSCYIIWTETDYYLSSVSWHENKIIIYIICLNYLVSITLRRSSSLV